MRGSTRVPVLGRDSTSPLPASTLIASRNTVRLTPSISLESSAVGSTSPAKELALHDAHADLLDDGGVQSARCLRTTGRSLHYHPVSAGNAERLFILHTNHMIVVMGRARCVKAGAARTARG